MSLVHARTLEGVTRAFAQLVALLTVVAAVGASTPFRVDAQQQPPSVAHAPKAAKAMQKQLSLRNTTKDTVTVELRLGDAPDCAANPLATTQRVPPGRESARGVTTDSRVRQRAGVHEPTLRSVGA